MNWKKLMAPHHQYTFGDTIDFISAQSLPHGPAAFGRWLYEEEHRIGHVFDAVYAFLAAGTPGRPIVITQMSREGDLLVHPLLAAVYVATRSPSSLVEVLTHASGIMPTFNDRRLADLAAYNAQLLRDRAQMTADISKLHLEIDATRSDAWDVLQADAARPRSIGPFSRIARLFSACVREP